METLVEKIKKEWETFETNANAVVEKGNKSSRRSCSQSQLGTGITFQRVP